MRAIHGELNVLVADDDRITRNALRLLLPDNGCMVVGGAAGGERRWHYACATSLTSASAQLHATHKRQ